MAAPRAAAPVPFRGAARGAADTRARTTPVPCACVGRPRAGERGGVVPSAGGILARASRRQCAGVAPLAAARGHGERSSPSGAPSGATRAVAEAQQSHVVLETTREYRSGTPPSGPAATLCVVSSEPLAGGTLHVARVGPLTLRGRVEPQRTLRCWLPVGPAPPGGFPVLVLLDGQNLFGREGSWRAAAAAAAATTQVAVLGVDHAGALRSDDFVPFKPGTGAGAFRPDAASWPGGGADMFLSALHDQVLPAADAAFGLSVDPARRAFGGSSFGAVAALHALVSRHPLASQFGNLLLESPSLWIDESRWLADVLLPALSAPDARLPRRVHLAMGGREHTGTRPGAEARLGAAADTLHSSSARRLASAFRMAYAARDPERVDASLQFVLEMDAAHSERDWARRLPGALAFLFAAEQPEAAVAASIAMQHAAKPPAPATPAPRKRAAARAAAAAPAAPAAPSPAAPASPPSPPRQPVSELAAAAASRGAMVFFDPPMLVAGSPSRIFMDRRRSDPLRERPNVKMHYGWNGWSHAAAAPVVLLPAGDAGGAGGGDWWSGELLVAPDASELNFVFSDGDGVWDNAHGRDYSVPVADAAADAAAIAPRRIASQETHALAGGTLHIIKLALRDGLAPGAEARAARWQEEKVLRVWTPPGWDRATAQDLPVLYMVESQNLFEDWLAHQGVSWRAAETAAGLLESGALPPFLIVGIDAVGHFRSLNYLPFAPGTGVGDFRHECARWPGGNVDAFLRRVRTDVLPLAEREFGASTRRERRAFGGASFGGVAALHAALTCADIFGGVLAESPSLWAGEGRYLDTLRSHHGALPDRLFLGSGTREYSATRDHEHHDHDARLAHYHREAAGILEHRLGMRDGRLKFVCDEGAGHHEGAWGWRLGGALVHLFHGR